MPGNQAALLTSRGNRRRVAICETCGIRASIVCNHDGRVEWYFCDAHYQQHMRLGHGIITTADAERQRRRQFRRDRKLAWLERKARKWLGLTGEMR
jgi:hypothetical protein